MKVSSFIIFVVLLASCRHDPSANVIDRLPNEMPLNINTYDGSGQGVHPDILYLHPPLRGNCFLLAFTPYPYFNSKFENPSILASKNGTDFYEEQPDINPLEPTPAYDHNDDPDLIYDPVRHLYYLHYLETMRPDSENVIRMESPDALTWEKHTAIHYDLHTDRFVVSPAICHTPQGSYVMYHVNLSVQPYRVEWLTSPDGLAWNKGNITPISSDLNDTLTPWHIDVLYGMGKYFILASCRTHPSDPNHQSLMLGESIDGQNWHFHSRPLISTQPGFHDCMSMYRSTGMISDHTLAVYYSMVNTNNVWSIGMIKFDMDTL